MRKRLIILVAVGFAAAVSYTCSPVYVMRAGLEEARILSRRRPIEEIVRDPATDPETRRKLGLVLQARTFAQEFLGLDAGESYTTYSWIDRDTLALVVSAARRDRFEPVTWWFPIVGRVPYKGFFSLESATREAERLERRGFDTYVRPTTAFSTLGWFNDPLLSTLLRYDDVTLVATVIHELTHNTVFIPGQVAFNESFASFVGDRGAAEFFCAIEGEEGERCIRAQNEWADNLVFSEYLGELIRELEALYARTDLDTEELLERRAAIFDAARQRFQSEYAPRLKTASFRNFSNAAINNAHLVAWRLYYHRLQEFEAAFQRFHGDLPAVVQAIIDAAADRREDPYGAVALITPAP